MLSPLCVFASLKATCCSDGVHCCPNGYTCNVASGTCSREDVTMPWVEKIVAQPVKVGPDFWPCQPYLFQLGFQKVRVAWHLVLGPPSHPESNRFYPVTQTFYAKLKFMLKQLHDINPWCLLSLLQVGNVICPGGQYQCPDGNTCCKLSTGQYGCCPYAKVSGHTGVRSHESAQIVPCSKGNEVYM